MNATMVRRLWLPVSVVALVAIVAVQSVALYRLNKRVTAAVGPNERNRPEASLLLQKQPMSTPSQPSQQHSQTQTKDDPFDSLGSLWADPFAEMRRMHRQMDQMFENLMNHSSGFGNLSADPFDNFISRNFDLREDNDHYVVRVEVPDANKANVNVSIEDRTLKISSNSDVSNDENSKAGLVSRQRSMSEFEQSIMLPGPVDSSKMKTKIDNGQLIITIPKMAHSKRHSTRSVT